MRVSELEARDRISRVAEEIMARVAEGVVILDLGLAPVSLNATARKLLGLSDSTPIASLPNNEVLASAKRATAMGEVVESTVELWSPARAVVRVRAEVVEDLGLVFLILQDVSGEHLAQRIRRQFVTNASHELKSPAAAILGLAEALEEAMGEDPQSAAGFAQRLVAESQRLNMLIRDLLDLSRLEEPDDLTAEAIDLARVAAAETHQLRPVASEKSITLRAAIEAGALVRGDARQIGLMIRNLLENAVRYTPPGGSVELEVSKLDGRIEIRVTDTGIGIPLKDQGRVFERFYRVDEARSRDRGGTGLGLAIVKHVAELHGGAVTVGSELGQGSCFTVVLPAS